MAPVVLDNDGITLRAKAGTAAGTTFEINSVTYTVVDNNMLKSWISAEKDLSKAVTTLVTDMKELFKDNATFNTNISSWDVSNVTTMEGMFEGAAYFNKDISKWDTNKVTNMDKMFKSATNFNQDLSKWCVTNLTTEPTDFVSGTSCDSENKPKVGNLA
jgi:surface protein